MFVDYGLGQPGSVHDAYAFQGTQTATSSGRTLPQGHWIWVDSAYSSERWCVVPFKKPWNRNLTYRQNIYNCYLSRLVQYIQMVLTKKSLDAKSTSTGSHESQACVCSPKGMFPVALWASPLDINTWWPTCCMILHNMIVYFEDL